MITEDYVSFEVAKLLKAKGFRETLTSFYNGDGEINFDIEGMEDEFVHLTM